MLNMFLDTMMADPPPQCLVWLPLMHRLAHVENGECGLTLHPVGCREEDTVGSVLSCYCEKQELLAGHHWKLCLLFSEEEIYFLTRAGVLSLT